MRKIEKEMNVAVSRQQNWSSANTMVSISDEGNALVYLHGHHIATVNPRGDVSVRIDTLHDWPTVTTKSRLRALGVPVATKKGRTYVNGCDIANYGYQAMTVDYNDTRYYG